MTEDAVLAEGIDKGVAERAGHEGAGPQEGAGEDGAGAQAPHDADGELRQRHVEGGQQQGAADAAQRLSSACEGGKVVVLLKATGDAPILKQSKFKVNATDRVAKVADFVRKNVKKDAVYLYIASTFQPAADRLLGDLFDSYGTGGKLVFQYATTPAWG
eukprot:PRCOL_00003774-RA